MEWNGLALKYIINTKRDRITCNLFPNLMTTALNECAIEHDDESFLRMNCKQKRNFIKIHLFSNVK